MLDKIAQGYAAELSGRMPLSIGKGIITDVNESGQIKVTTAIMPGINSNWISRLKMIPGIDCDHPKIGQTALIFYEESNPLIGFYMLIDNDVSNVLGNKDSPSDDYFQTTPGIMKLVAGDENIKVTLIENRVVIDGNVIINGDTPVDVIINGSVQINGNLAVAGNITITGTGGGSGTINITGNLALQGNMTLTSTSSASINGKQIATVGAIDSRNDTLISKGW